MALNSCPLHALSIICPPAAHHLPTLPTLPIFPLCVPILPPICSFNAVFVYVPSFQFIPTTVTGLAGQRLYKFLRFDPMKMFNLALYLLALNESFKILSNILNIKYNVVHIRTTFFIILCIKTKFRKLNSEHVLQSFKQ